MSSDNVDDDADVVVENEDMVVEDDNVDDVDDDAEIYASQPSDSSSEELAAVDVESEEYIPTESEAMMNGLLDDLPDSATAVVDSATRSAINEALIKLEAMNPTEDPTTSSLLNGVWTLKYSGGYANDWALPSPTRGLALFLYDGGLSPGLFALSLAQKLPSEFVELGDLSILISREQPRIEASIDTKLFGNESQIRVNADLEIETGMRMKESYEKASVMGNDVEIPEQIRYSRELYITYLDDDLLVVRTASGVPEILMRQK